MLYKATIEILVDVANEIEACDCLSEALRPLLKIYEPQSSIVDWAYLKPVNPEKPEDTWVVDDGTFFENV